MSIRIMLVPLAGDQEDELALDLAAVIARRFEAHIDAIFVQPDPRDTMPMVGETMSAQLVQEAVEAAEREGREAAARARKTFDAWQTRVGFPLAETPGAGKASAAWTERMGREDAALPVAARISDLVAIARPGPDTSTSRRLAVEATLMEGGRPVLVAPPAPQSAEPLGTVLVAWNGSAESARAVALAMPLLTQAEAVHVFTAEERGVESGMAQALIRYLAWHGIEAAAVAPDATAPSVGVALLAAADRIRAGLVVMGAYTHSRMRQIMFGGVTRHVLAHAEVPVLLVH